MSKSEMHPIKRADGDPEKVLREIMEAHLSNATGSYEDSLGKDAASIMWDRNIAGQGFGNEKQIAQQIKKK